MSALFILGGNDAEMMMIEGILDACGIEHTAPLSGWGAKPNLESLDVSGKEIVFVECLPPEGFVGNLTVIDHHGERSGEPASIMQVIDLIRYKPRQEEARLFALIAANDNGYIPGMLTIGATNEEIAAVREIERNAQGITPLQEEQAESALQPQHYKAAADGRLVIVKCEHSKSTPITDRLFTSWRSGEKLLIIAPDEVNFYGDGALCAELENSFGGWSGGAGRGITGGQAYYGCGDVKAINRVIKAVKEFYNVK
jgi:hypothetical protein